MRIEINAILRQKQGTGASRRLRRAGRVPGVLYGAGRGAEAIEVDLNDLYRKLKLEAFHSSILEMRLNGSQQPVLLRAVQMHPFRPLVLHVDFQRVAADIKIHMRVPLHFINADTAPGVKLSGGIVSHVMNEVEVSCLPASLPEFIDVDLEDLTAGHSIHLSDLKVPEGVELVALTKGEDLPVATIVIPRAVVAEEEEAAAAEVTPAAADVPAVNQPPKEKVEEKDKDKEKDKKK
jgi:large subunit ribosomal protein L25